MSIKFKILFKFSESYNIMRNTYINTLKGKRFQGQILLVY